MTDIKVKRLRLVYLYSALFIVPHTQGAQAWITQCYLQLHQCLPLPRKHSPYGASPDWACAYLIAAYYLYLPQKDERLSRFGWLTYSGRFTHISSHPSAAGRAQDRESSPVKDRPSTNCGMQPTTTAHNQSCHIPWHTIIVVRICSLLITKKLYGNVFLVSYA